MMRHIHDKIRSNQQPKTKTCKVDSLQRILPGTHHTVDNKIDRWVDEYKISDQHIHLPLDGGRVVPK